MYDSDVTVVSETELDVVQAALYNSLVVLVSAIELDVEFAADDVSLVEFVSVAELVAFHIVLYNSLVALVSAIELDVAQAVNRESDDADDSANVLVDISTSETVSEVDTLDSDILADVLYDAE